MLATSFAEAAGVAGRQKWGLVLSSSARVSQVTYQTVVGVRYPELVTYNGTSWNFGKFVTHERPRRGGFLPVFWGWMFLQQLHLHQKLFLQMHQTELPSVDSEVYPR